MKIDESFNKAYILDKGGYPYIIHQLMDGVPRVDPALLKEWAQWAAKQPCLENVDLLVAPEAMALPLATAISLETGIPFVVVRKRKYELPGETIAYCETGYSQSCLYINDVKSTDRVVVIDDVVSTGGTLESLLESLHSMDVTVAGVLLPFEKGDGAQRLRQKTAVPIVAMRRIDVDGAKVSIS
jgi:adenine phosphoribosyltransferase